MLKILKALFLYLIAGCMNAFAQDMPVGRFLQDSVRIGEHTAYSLVFRHENLEVVFPDSSYNYYPFEYIRKDYFRSRTAGPYVIDSAVYYLATFETDSVLPLALPVIILHDGDSSVHFAKRDTILLERTVLAIPDSIALKDSSFYREVPGAFNYPYMLLGMAGLLALSGIIFALFGKTIKRKYQLHKLRKEHRQFVKTINGLMNQMNGNPSRQVGQIVLEWKRYLEALENKPFTKLTTREIIKMTPNEPLEHTLKSLDTSLYGNKEFHHLKECIDVLMDYSHDRFARKMEEVNHA